jgi:predicted enzyme related to lactoylglutathione lyase
MEVMLAGYFVEDLEIAKKFYLEKLGLKVMFESPGFCEVSHGKGGMVIGLSQSPRPSGQDGAVVCFKVADLPSEEERLLKLGVRFEGAVFEKPGIVRIANFRDPFANRLQLVEHLRPR